jgi:hypothetical protein
VTHHYTCFTMQKALNTSQPPHCAHKPPHTEEPARYRSQCQSPSVGALFLQRYLLLQLSHGSDLRQLNQEPFAQLAGAEVILDPSGGRQLPLALQVRQEGPAEAAGARIVLNLGSRRQGLLQFLTLAKRSFNKNKRKKNANRC